MSAAHFHSLSAIRNGGEGRGEEALASRISPLPQWNKNCEGVLLEIWHALHRRTGCVKVMRKEHNHRFVPPKPEQLTGEPKPLPRKRASSPRPSPPSAGGVGEERRFVQEGLLQDTETGQSILPADAKGQ